MVGVAHFPEIVSFWEKQELSVDLEGCRPEIGGTDMQENKSPESQNKYEKTGIRETPCFGKPGPHLSALNLNLGGEGLIATLAAQFKVALSWAPISI